MTASFDTAMARSTLDAAPRHLPPGDRLRRWCKRRLAEGVARLWAKGAIQVHPGDCARLARGGIPQRRQGTGAGHGRHCDNQHGAIHSESAINVPVEMVHYGMTKTAQLAVSRGVAETVAGTGVTVNAVLPGPTRSEGVGAFVEQLARAQGMSFEQAEAEFFKTQRPASLLKRFATVDEVANMVVYLCSPAASATNGAAVRVDGGVVKSIL